MRSGAGARSFASERIREDILHFGYTQHTERTQDKREGTFSLLNEGMNMNFDYVRETCGEMVMEKGSDVAAAGGKARNLRRVRTVLARAGFFLRNFLCSQQRALISLRSALAEGLLSPLSSLSRLKKLTLLDNKYPRPQIARHKLDKSTMRFSVAIAIIFFAVSGNRCLFALGSGGDLDGYLTANGQLLLCQLDSTTELGKDKGIVHGVVKLTVLARILGSGRDHLVVPYSQASQNAVDRPWGYKSIWP